jgi:hypothetical protein
MKKCIGQEFGEYEMIQYDWLQYGSFTGHGLHNIQDFSGGELQAWINKKGHGCQHGNIFVLGESFLSILSTIPTIASNNLALG